MNPLLPFKAILVNGFVVTVLLGAASMSVQGVPAQEIEALHVGDDRLLGLDDNGRPIVEPWIAVHPGDASTLLATAMVASIPPPPAGEGLTVESTCATWLSRDGGQTWARHDHRVPGCADPWTAFTAAGTALFTALGNGGTHVYRSVDSGSTWEKRVPLGDGHDHPILLADTTSGPFSGNVYFVSGRGGLNRERQRRSTVYVARSADDGRSFPFVEQVIASNLSYEAQVPVILSDGTLLVPFSDHHTLDGRRLDIGARRSWIVRSRDGGNTFSEPLFITDACGGRGGWPMLTSGREDDIWFICAARESNGILIFRSDDRGESWSGPVRVDGDRENAWTRIPTAAVSESGAMAAAWYDRTHDRTRSCQHLMIAVSLDRGESFSAPVRVTTRESCPDSEANYWTAERFPAGGDYSGLVATGPDSFRVVWSDARDGLYHLRTAEVHIER